MIRVLIVGSFDDAFVPALLPPARSAWLDPIHVSEDELVGTSALTFERSALQRFGALRIAGRRVNVDALHGFVVRLARH